MRKKSHGQALKQTNGYHDMILPDTTHFFKADLQCPWRSFGWWPYETTMDDGRSPRIPVAHPLGASPWLRANKVVSSLALKVAWQIHGKKRHHKTSQDITRHYKTSRHNQLISMETYWGLTTFTRYLSINQQGLKFILHSSTSRKSPQVHAISVHLCPRLSSNVVQQGKLSKAVTGMQRAQHLPCWDELCWPVPSTISTPSIGEETCAIEKPWDCVNIFLPTKSVS